MNDQRQKEKLPYSALRDAIEAYMTAAYEHYEGGQMTPMIATLSAINNAAAFVTEMVARKPNLLPNNVSIVKEMHVMHEWQGSLGDWEQKYYQPALEEINS